MSKHQTPWTYEESTGFVTDANDVGIFRVHTRDPETRAVLAHAADMWKMVQNFAEHEGNIPAANQLVDKIEAEIAKARRS